MNCGKWRTACVLETCARGELLPGHRLALLGGKRNKKRGPEQKNRRVSYHVGTQPLLNVLHDRGLWDGNLGRAARWENKAKNTPRNTGPERDRRKEGERKERGKRNKQKTKHKYRLCKMHCCCKNKTKKCISSSQRDCNRTEKSTRTNKAV